MMCRSTRLVGGHLLQPVAVLPWPWPYGSQSLLAPRVVKLTGCKVQRVGLSVITVNYPLLLITFCVMIISGKCEPFECSGCGRFWN